jgi:hypothetical protein
MLSQMMDELERLSEAALVGKSERQRKRWRTPKETTLATFVEAVGGDRPMSTLSRTDVLSFRQRLQDRVVAGEIAIDTANKIIGHVAGMFCAINDVNQYGLPNVFAKGPQVAAPALRQGAHAGAQAQVAQAHRLPRAQDGVGEAGEAGFFRRCPDLRRRAARRDRGLGGRRPDRVPRRVGARSPS